MSTSAGGTAEAGEAALGRMSDPFTIERFLPRVGQVFHVGLEERGTVDVLLSEVTRLVTDASRLRRREPFSLLFHAPPGTVLEQRIYQVEGEGLGPFECFLVPIGPDRFGMRFEAVYT